MVEGGATDAENDVSGGDDDDEVDRDDDDMDTQALRFVDRI